jgi:hypothetical protein
MLIYKLKREEVIMNEKKQQKESGGAMDKRGVEVLAM